MPARSAKPWIYAILLLLLAIYSLFLMRLMRAAQVPSPPRFLAPHVKYWKDLDLIVIEPRATTSPVMFTVEADETIRADQGLKPIICQAKLSMFDQTIEHKTGRGHPRGVKIYLRGPRTVHPSHTLDIASLLPEPRKSVLHKVVPYSFSLVVDYIKGGDFLHKGNFACDSVAGSGRAFFLTADEASQAHYYFMDSSVPELGLVCPIASGLFLLVAIICAVVAIGGSDISGMGNGFLLSLLFLGLCALAVGTGMVLDNKFGEAAQRRKATRHPTSPAATMKVSGQNSDLVGRTADSKQVPTTEKSETASGAITNHAPTVYQQALHGMRVWRDSSGKYQTEAELIEVEDNSVILRATDGRVLKVPLARLSKPDRDYLSTGTANDSGDEQVQGTTTPQTIPKTIPETIPNVNGDPEGHRQPDDVP